MSVYELNPLQDPRWPEFLQAHPRASVFHTCGWLRSLEQAYGYTPIAFSTSPPGQELTNAVVFCEVRSWLTGRRLVSLPFSDHCEPLLDRAADPGAILGHLNTEIGRRGLKYVEFRPLETSWEGAGGICESTRFTLHRLDLRPASQEIFRRFHKDSIQRKITRAEREGLSYSAGTGPEFVDSFYRLMVITRKRHGLPPAPMSWFSKLVQYCGNGVRIRLASHNGTPVAAILTLSYKESVVYKYGCSDSRFNNMGGTPYLFWMTIQEAKSEGRLELDLGRSDTDNPGLITFKQRLGGTESALRYWRLSPRAAESKTEGHSFHLAKRMFAAAPDRLRIQVGNMLYKHLG